MPLHDWARVDAGIFHDFQVAWVTALTRELFQALKPEFYSALAEPVNPRACEQALHEPYVDPDAPTAGMLTARLRTRIVARVAEKNYTALQHRIAVYPISGDSPSAYIEFTAPGNKVGDFYWRTFRDRCCEALTRGAHVLVVDLLPPSPRDPGGVHGSIWHALTGEGFQLPADANRTVVSYSVGAELTAYIEPVAVGRELRAMPLFLTPEGEGYIEVPLQATYLAAYEGVPARYRRELEVPN